MSCRHRERCITSGVPARSAISSRMSQATSANAIRAKQRAWGLPHSRLTTLRADGLRPASPDPWETPVISHWRTFSALLRRVGTHPAQATKEGPVTSGTARRNQTTSAAARRVRYAPALQPPLPARDIETLRDAPLKTSRVYRLVPVKPWAGTHMNIILSMEMSRVFGGDDTYAVIPGRCGTHRTRNSA
jgi:hypothetical protein